MYIIVILIFSLLLVIFITVLIKLFLYKKQIRDIAMQIREFREKKTGKKITTEIYDKDIEDLTYETNEFLELYRKSEQEKVQFENTLQQGIANMSHDLRTPLTSIIGYLKLLQNDEINKEEALGVIKSKTDKLNVLINDFFELAFIESKDYKLKITKLNLTNIIQDEILSFYEAFETKGIEPIINIPKESIFINGDKNSLERIIDNLLSNTLKYSQRYVEINVKSSRSTATLTISNKCTNIDEKDVIYMFDRFYRADKVRKGQGTGLGLSIAKSLMQKMNGSIRSDFENNKITIVCEWEINNEQ
ncbi:HAMP domain-containing sensor histidine kinase [Clostridium sp. KNHs214]|uniref:sensor histidine kinase n=1 Tax=Clostridium sp. KNHs214 TaxID=1540257 RepID=UPI00054EBEDA|nr:HAMP domain-containing sensor histidine kinase [Clostridium sp. KNHs214]